MCGCSRNIENCDDVIIVRRCVCWCEPVLARPRSERRNRDHDDERRHRRRRDERRNRSHSEERRNRPHHDERRAHRSQCHIEGISLQLTTIDEKELPSKCPIIFNERLTDNTRFINYRDETGVIEIFRHGMYMIDWDVAVKGTSQEEETCVRFGLEINGEVKAASTLPVPVGQLNGQALIHVDQIPTTVRLINDTDESVQLSTFTPIGNLRVVSVE